MGDAITNFLYLYSIVSRFATEYNELPSSASGLNTNTKGGAYGQGILNICSYGGADTTKIRGKLWILQDISGTVPGSLGAALSQVNDSLEYPTTEWGITQATNVYNLCKLFGNDFLNSVFGHLDVDGKLLLTASDANILFYWQYLANIEIPANKFGTINLTSFDGIFQTQVDTVCSMEITGHYSEDAEDFLEKYFTLSLISSGVFVANILITQWTSGSGEVIINNTESGTWTAGDVFKIRDTSNDMSIYQNDTPIIYTDANYYTSSVRHTFSIRNTVVQDTPIYLSKTTGVASDF